MRAVIPFRLVILFCAFAVSWPSAQAWSAESVEEVTYDDLLNQLSHRKLKYSDLTITLLTPSCFRLDWNNHLGHASWYWKSWSQQVPKRISTFFGYWFVFTVLGCRGFNSKLWNFVVGPWNKIHSRVRSQGCPPLGPNRRNSPANGAGLGTRYSNFKTLCLE